MKKLPFYLGLCALVLSLPGHAAIYKCVIGHTVTYQDTPCDHADGSVLVVASIRTRPEVRIVEPAAANGNEATPDLFLRSANQPPALTLGMLDTQVLNLHGWGRPSKITRSKSNRAWREAWTYFSPHDGERQLQFANGKLTAIQ